MSVKEKAYLDIDLVVAIAGQIGVVETLLSPRLGDCR